MLKYAAFSLTCVTPGLNTTQRCWLPRSCCLSGHAQSTLDYLYELRVAPCMLFNPWLTCQSCWDIKHPAVQDHWSLNGQQWPWEDKANICPRMHQSPRPFHLLCFHITSYALKQHGMSKERTDTSHASGDWGLFFQIISFIMSLKQKKDKTLWRSLCRLPLEWQRPSNFQEFP